MINKIKNIKGFTLAEVVIVMIIIGLLMTISTRMYYDEKDKFVYNNSLTKMLSLIKTARNYAITSSPIYINGKAIIPTNGYGIYINLAPASEKDPHFTVFASLGDNDGDSSTLNKRYDKGQLTSSDNKKDYIIETYRLPKEVAFKYFIFNQDGKTPIVKWNKETNQLSATEAVILFRPPLAQSYIGKNNDKNLEEVSMRFFNGNAPSDSPKRCQYLSINRIQTFPTIKYNNCVDPYPKTN